MPSLACAAAPGLNPPVRLLLEIVVNGQDTGNVGRFYQSGDALLAPRGELASLGLILPLDTDENGLVALGSLKNVTYWINQASQTLMIVATAGGIEPTQLNGRGESAEALPVETGTGTLLNYDVLANSQLGGDSAYGPRNVVSGLFDARIFSPAGILDSSLIAGNADTGSSQAVIRLNTTYSYAEPDQLRLYQLGDFISGSLSWSRSVRMGGAQIATNFAEQPDLITYPLPTISGQAAVPSSVDVLVNGVRQLSAQVNPGPFEVTQLPVVNGSGQISVVVHNALGQQVTETLPFYATPSMLAVGLTAYSVETGFVRRGFGFVSDDYQTPAASASWRYGVAQWLTVEAHGEAASRLAEGGAGIVFTADNAAVISLSGAGSHSGGSTGMQYAAQIEHTDPYFNLGASVQQATPGYRDIAALSDDPVPRLILQAGIGVNCCAAGSVGMNFTKIQSFDEDETIVTLSYNRAISGRAYVSADAFREFGHGGGSGVMLSLSLLFGQRGSIDIGPTINDGQAAGMVQVTQATPTLGDIGGQFLASDGQRQPAHAFGELSYYSPYGLFGAGIDKSGGSQTLRATADGALAFEDGALFATNTVYDSFAVVDTNGVAGVHVETENRPAGETGASGKLLVPDLRSFEVNHIDIDPNDVPINDTLDSPSRLVRPQDMAGVIVKFPIMPSNGAILRLVDPAGAVLPLGSTARLEGSAQVMTVGYDGEVFLQALQARNVVAVIRPDGATCTAEFNFAPVPGRIPKLGLVCRGPLQ